jgi:hypothetical protein
MPDINETMQFDDLAQQALVIYKDQRCTVKDAMNRALTELSKKVYQYKRGGNITLKIEMKPDAMNLVKIEVLIHESQPKAGAIAMAAYLDSRGNLYGDDPNQQPLPGIRDFKRVAAGDDE